MNDDNEPTKQRFMTIGPVTDLVELAAALNELNEGSTRVIAVEKQGGGWIALLDRAIQVIITPDLLHDYNNGEFDDGFDEDYGILHLVQVKMA